MISILCLSVTGALCGAAVFSHRFDDNLLQRVGLSAVALWCLARLPEKVASMHTEPVHLVLHLGLACYAVGLAIKVRRSQHMRRRVGDDIHPSQWPSISSVRPTVSMLPSSG